MPCLLIQGRRGDEVRSFKQIAASGKPNPTGQHHQNHNPMGATTPILAKYAV
jgi:hypothetical protein